MSLHPLWEEVLEVRGGATAPRAPLHAAALSPNDASSSAGECLYIKRSCGVVLIENRKQENGPGPGRREGSRVPREPAMPRNVKIPSFYSVFQFGKHPTPVIASFSDCSNWTTRAREYTPLGESICPTQACSLQTHQPTRRDKVKKTHTRAASKYTAR